MIDTTVSHFRITAKLGEGGMGEVYRAEDTKLGRQVAIKVLPEAVAGDPQRLARFEREARVLASLNHPNIAGIHQVEEATGQHLLIMELVEGEDLKERLSRGPIPVDEALPIVLQVAQALEAAHASGVVHRDLKPANVKVTPEGQVKVLDFGLAKALDPSEASGEGSAGSGVGTMHLSLSPTLTQQMTGAGVILGTAAYMAPEQARGKSVDARADVWAFGVLMWEILTGQSMFAGETVTDVIAAVVTQEPDLAALPEATPVEARRLLERCLRKDPRRRLPDIGAARLELEDLLEGGSKEPTTATADLSDALEAQRRSRLRERWLWATGALVAAGLAVAALLLTPAAEPPPRPTVHFKTSAPAGWSFARSWAWPVPSPDGRQVAFLVHPVDQVAPDQGTVWLRSLESPGVRPLGGTEGAALSPPTWSPDGQSLLIQVEDELRRFRLADGLGQRVTTLPTYGAFTASWGSSGTILLCQIYSSAVIHSVAETGGDSKPLTTLDVSRGEEGHLFPQFLDDGRRFLFLVFAPQSENSGLYLASLDDPDQRRKVADDWVRRFLVGDHLLFSREGTLYAQRFDAAAAAVSGEPIAVASSVPSWSGDLNIGWFGGSAGSTLSFVSGAGSASFVHLAWVDREGAVSQTIGPPGDYGQIALSPDGRNVALEIRDEEGQFDLWVMEIARGVTSRVTLGPTNERDPVWSPDGRSLAYIRRDADGVGTLMRKGLRASDPETELGDSADEEIPESWADQGETLLVVRRNAADEQSVWALPLAEGGEARPVLDTGFRVDEPQISPDGRWLAYVSPESDREEVYIEPFAQLGDRLRVSLEGGGQPKWRGDSRELFFVTLDGVLMAVDVGSDGDGRLEVSLPRQLFELFRVEGMGYDDYGVDADGSRFLVKVPIEQEVEPALEIIANWTGLLD